VIYAIEAVGSGFIKFGRATSVGTRLKQMETGCPFDLHIMVVADWPDGAERAIHLFLAQSAQRGEWFKDGERTREVLGWMANGITGLEQLQAKSPRHIKSSRPRVSLARTRENWPESVARRRAERAEYWRVRSQHYDNEAPQHDPIMPASNCG
jgi:hypothetical protein